MSPRNHKVRVLLLVLLSMTCLSRNTHVEGVNTLNSLEGFAIAADSLYGSEFTATAIPITNGSTITVPAQTIRFYLRISVTVGDSSDPNKMCVELVSGQYLPNYVRWELPYSLEPASTTSMTLSCAGFDDFSWRMVKVGWKMRINTEERENATDVTHVVPGFPVFVWIAPYQSTLSNVDMKFAFTVTSGKISKSELIFRKGVTTGQYIIYSPLWKESHSQTVLLTATRVINTTAGYPKDNTSDIHSNDEILLGNPLPYQIHVVPNGVCGGGDQSDDGHINFAENSGTRLLSNFGSDPSNSDFTICYWYRPLPTSVGDQVWVQVGVAVDSFVMGVYGGERFGVPYFLDRRSGTDVLYQPHDGSTYWLNLQKWTHVCFLKFADLTAQIFLGGQVVTSAPSKTSRKSMPLWDIVVGGADEMNPAAGSLDSLFIWARALAPLEIYQGYQTHAWANDMGIRETFRAAFPTNFNPYGERGPYSFHWSRSDSVCTSLAPQHGTLAYSPGCIAPFNHLSLTIGQGRIGIGGDLNTGGPVWNVDNIVTLGNAWTICFWVHRAANHGAGAANRQTIFTYGTTTAPEQQAQATMFFSDKHIGIEASTQKGSTLVDLTQDKEGTYLDPTDIGVWVHWCLRYDNQVGDDPPRRHLIRNGRWWFTEALQKSFLDHIAPGLYPASLCLGCIFDPITPLPLDGYLDEFYIFNSGVRFDQLQSYYARSNWPASSLYIPFNDGVGTKVLNSSMNGIQTEMMLFVGTAVNIVTNGMINSPAGETCVTTGPEWNDDAVSLNIPQVCPLNTYTDGAIATSTSQTDDSGTVSSISYPYQYTVGVIESADEFQVTHTPYTASMWFWRGDTLRPSLLMRIGCAATAHTYVLDQPSEQPVFDTPPSMFMVLKTAMERSGSLEMIEETSIWDGQFDRVGSWAHVALTHSLTTTANFSGFMNFHDAWWYQPMSPRENYELDCAPGQTKIGVDSAVFNGRIDEFRFWNRLLSTQEIQQVYEGQSFFSRVLNHNTLLNGLQFHATFSEQTGLLAYSSHTLQTSPLIPPSRAITFEPQWYGPGITTYLLRGNELNHTYAIPIVDGSVNCLPSNTQGHPFVITSPEIEKLNGSLLLGMSATLTLTWLQTMGLLGLSVQVNAPRGIDMIGTPVIYYPGEGGRKFAITSPKSFTLVPRRPQLVTLTFSLFGSEAVHYNNIITPSYSFWTFSEIDPSSIQLSCFLRDGNGDSPSQLIAFQPPFDVQNVTFVTGATIDSSTMNLCQLKYTRVMNVSESIRIVTPNSNELLTAFPTVTSQPFPVRSGISLIQIISAYDGAWSFNLNRKGISLISLVVSCPTVALHGDAITMKTVVPTLAAPIVLTYSSPDTTFSPVSHSIPASASNQTVITSFSIPIVNLLVNSLRQIQVSYACSGDGCDQLLNPTGIFIVKNSYYYNPHLQQVQFTYPGFSAISTWDGNDSQLMTDPAPIAIAQSYTEYPAFYLKFTMPISKIEWMLMNHTSPLSPGLPPNFATDARSLVPPETSPTTYLQISQLLRQDATSGAPYVVAVRFTSFDAVMQRVVFFAPQPQWDLLQVTFECNSTLDSTAQPRLPSVARNFTFTFNSTTPINTGGVPFDISIGGYDACRVYMNTSTTAFQSMNVSIDSKPITSYLPITHQWNINEPQIRTLSAATPLTQAVTFTTFSGTFDFKISSNSTTISSLARAVSALSSLRVSDATGIPTDLNIASAQTLWSVSLPSNITQISFAVTPVFSRVILQYALGPETNRTNITSSRIGTLSVLPNRMYNLTLFVLVENVETIYQIFIFIAPIETGLSSLQVSDIFGILRDLIAPDMNGTAGASNQTVWSVTLPSNATQISFAVVPINLAATLQYALGSQIIRTNMTSGRTVTLNHFLPGTAYNLTLFVLIQNTETIYQVRFFIAATESRLASLRFSDTPGVLRDLISSDPNNTAATSNRTSWNITLPSNITQISFAATPINLRAVLQYSLSSQTNRTNFTSDQTVTLSGLLPNYSYNLTIFVLVQNTEMVYQVRIVITAKPINEYIPPEPIILSPCSATLSTCQFGSECRVDDSDATQSTCICSTAFRGPQCQFGVLQCVDCILPLAPSNSSIQVFSQITLIGIGLNRITRVQVGGAVFLPSEFVRFQAANVSHPLVQTALSKKAWDESLTQGKQNFTILTLSVDLAKVALDNTTSDTLTPAAAGINRHTRVLLATTATGSKTHISLIFDLLFASTTSVSYSELIVQSPHASCNEGGNIWKPEPREPSRCLPCPLGGTCVGGGIVYPNPGYWSANEVSAPIKCSLDEVQCPGTNENSPTNEQGYRVTQVCGTSYTGVACAQCQPSHYQSNAGQCFPCSTIESEQAQLAGLLLLGVAVMSSLSFAVAFTSSTTLAFVVVLFVLLQTVIAVGKDASASWPPRFKPLSDLFNALGIINFDLTFMKPGCVAPTYSFISTYYGTLLFAGIAFLMFMAACLLRRQMFLVRLKAKYLLAKHDRTKKGTAAIEEKKKSKNQVAREMEAWQETEHKKMADETEQIKIGFKRRLIHATMILGSLFYLKLSTLNIHGLLCSLIPRPTALDASDDVVQDAGMMSVLTIDATIECWTGAHLGVTIVIIGLLVLFTFGFPVSCMIVLTRTFAPIILRNQETRDGPLGRVLVCLGYERVVTLEQREAAIANMGRLQRIAPIDPFSIESQAGYEIRQIPDHHKLTDAQKAMIRRTVKVIEEEEALYLVHMELFGYLFRGVKEQRYYFRLFAFPMSLLFVVCLILVPDILLRTFLFGLLYGVNASLHAFLIPFHLRFDNILSPGIQLASLIYTIGAIQLMRSETTSRWAPWYMLILFFIFIFICIQYIYHIILDRHKQSRGKLQTFQYQASQFALQENTNVKDVGEESGINEVEMTNGNRFKSRSSEIPKGLHNFEPEENSSSDEDEKVSIASPSDNAPPPSTPAIISFKLRPDQRVHELADGVKDFIPENEPVSIIAMRNQLGMSRNISTRSAARASKKASAGSSRAHSRTNTPSRQRPVSASVSAMNSPHHDSALLSPQAHSRTSSTSDIYRSHMNSAGYSVPQLATQIVDEEEGEGLHHAIATQPTNNHSSPQQSHQQRLCFPASASSSPPPSHRNRSNRASGRTTPIGGDPSCGLGIFGPR